jgi:hypothetical protein
MGDYGLIRRKKVNVMKLGIRFKNIVILLIMPFLFNCSNDDIGTSAERTEDNKNNSVKTVDPPSVFSISLVSSNSFFLHWQDVTRATKYQVYRSNELLGKYDKLEKYEKTDSVAYTSAFMIQTNSATYYYKVSSIDSFNQEGELSSPVAVTTPNASGRIRIINYADKEESIVYIKIISVQTETGITNTYLEESTLIPPGEIKIYENVSPGYYWIEVKFDGKRNDDSASTGHLSINREITITFNYNSSVTRERDYTYPDAFIPPEW